MSDAVSYKEDALIQGCIKGNRKDQEALYHLFSKKMFGICLRYTNNRSTAEDILQDAFIKVFRKLKDFRGEGSLEGWIRRVIVNTAIENYRKSVRLYSVVGLEDANIEYVQGSIIEKLKMDDLLTVIQKLPNGYRAIFNLYVIDGYTHKEIAKKLRITEGTSKSQLSRARNLLSKWILQLDKAKNGLHAEV